MIVIMLPDCSIAFQNGISRLQKMLKHYFQHRIWKQLMLHWRSLPRIDHHETPHVSLPDHHLDVLIGHLTSIIRLFTYHPEISYEDMVFTFNVTQKRDSLSLGNRQHAESSKRENDKQQTQMYQENSGKVDSPSTMRDGGENSNADLQKLVKNLNINTRLSTNMVSSAPKIKTNPISASTQAVQNLLDVSKGGKFRYLDSIKYPIPEKLQLCQRVGIEVQVNEFVHRYFYSDLHLEVINVTKIIVGLMRNFLPNQTLSSCVMHLKKGIESFVDRLNSIVYIERNVVLTTDEIVYAHILPYLWTELNCKRRAVRITLDSGGTFDIAHVLRKQGSSFDPLVFFRTVHFIHRLKKITKKLKDSGFQGLDFGSKVLDSKMNIDLDSDVIKAGDHDIEPESDDDITDGELVDNEGIESESGANDDITDGKLVDDEDVEIESDADGADDDIAISDSEIKEADGNDVEPESIADEIDEGGAKQDSVDGEADNNVEQESDDVEEVDDGDDELDSETKSADNGEKTGTKKADEGLEPEDGTEEDDDDAEPNFEFKGASDEDVEPESSIKAADDDVEPEYGDKADDDEDEEPESEPEIDFEPNVDIMKDQNDDREFEPDTEEDDDIEPEMDNDTGDYGPDIDKADVDDVQVRANVYSSNVGIGSSLRIEESAMARNYAQFNEIIFSMIYQTLHAMLMSISSIFTISSLDYFTILQPKWDIEHTITAYVEKIESLLIKGLIYAIALCNAEELGVVINNETQKSGKKVSRGNFEISKYFFDKSVETDFGAIITLGQIIREMYIGLIDIKPIRSEETDAEDPKGEEVSFGDYNIAYKSIDKETLLKSGAILYDLIAFGKVPTKTNKGLRYEPIQMTLDVEKHIADFNLFNLNNESVDPDAELSVSASKIKALNAGKKHESQVDEMKTECTCDRLDEEKDGIEIPSDLARFKKFLLIPQLLKYGFQTKTPTMVRKYAQWSRLLSEACRNSSFEVTLAAGTNHFWHNDEKARINMAEQFAVGIVLKDNNTRHKEWRPSFLVDSLSRRRFIDSQVQNCFEKRKPKEIDNQMMNSARLLSLRFYWKYIATMEHSLLALVFPVSWFDCEFNKFMDFYDKNMQKQGAYRKTLKFITSVEPNLIF